MQRNSISKECNFLSYYVVTFHVNRNVLMHIVNLPQAKKTCSKELQQHYSQWKWMQCQTNYIEFFEIVVDCVWQALHALHLSVFSLVYLQVQKHRIIKINGAHVQVVTCTSLLICIYLKEVCLGCSCWNQIKAFKWNQIKTSRFLALRGRKSGQAVPNSTSLLQVSKFSWIKKKMRHGSLRVLGLSAIPPKATCKTEPSGLIIPWSDSASLSVSHTCLQITGLAFNSTVKTFFKLFFRLS